MKLARAQQASAALGYRQTVLTALQDVENALVSYRSDQQQVEGLDETVAALQSAFTLASDSYRQGLSSFIEALDAQRQLAQARQQAEQARLQSTLDLVALYKALGEGGKAGRMSPCRNMPFLVQPKHRNHFPSLSKRAAVIRLPRFFWLKARRYFLKKSKKSEFPLFHSPRR